MGNNPLEIATYLFEFTCEFREILSNQCRIISANSVREFTFDDWHVNWPLNICSSHFCTAFLAMSKNKNKKRNKNKNKNKNKNGKENENENENNSSKHLLLGCRTRRRAIAGRKWKLEKSEEKSNKTGKISTVYNGISVN